METRGLFSRTVKYSYVMAIMRTQPNQFMRVLGRLIDEEGAGTPVDSSRVLPKKRVRVGSESTDDRARQCNSHRSSDLRDAVS